MNKKQKQEITNLVGEIVDKRLEPTNKTLALLNKALENLEPKRRLHYDAYAVKTPEILVCLACGASVNNDAQHRTMHSRWHELLGV